MLYVVINRLIDVVFQSQYMNVTNNDGHLHLGPVQGPFSPDWTTVMSAWHTHLEKYLFIPHYGPLGPLAHCPF
jgi:hypothetical protein